MAEPVAELSFRLNACLNMELAHEIHLSIVPIPPSFFRLPGLPALVPLLRVSHEEMQTQSATGGNAANMQVRRQVSIMFQMTRECSGKQSATTS